MLNVIALAFALATSVTPTNTTDTISTQKAERSSVAQVAIEEVEVVETAGTNLGSTTSEETDTIEYIRPNLYYFTDPDGNIWEFQTKLELPVGIEPESCEFFEYMRDIRWDVKSLIIRRHVGEVPDDVYIPTSQEITSIPSEGMTAIDEKGNEIPYQLCPSEELTFVEQITLIDVLLHREEEQTWMLTLYDYNLDGHIGIEDLVKTSQILFSSPCAFIYKENGEGYSWEEIVTMLRDNLEKGELEIFNPTFD